jgi:hypothetical protein
MYSVHLLIVCTLGWLFGVGAHCWVLYNIVGTLVQYSMIAHQGI